MNAIKIYIHDLKYHFNAMEKFCDLFYFKTF